MPRSLYNVCPCLKKCISGMIPLIEYKHAFLTCFFKLLLLLIIWEFFVSVGITSYTVIQNINHLLYQRTFCWPESFFYFLFFFLFFLFFLFSSSFFFLFLLLFFSLLVLFCQASLCCSVVLYFQWYLKPTWVSHENLMNMLTATFFQIINDDVNPGQT